MRDIFTPFSIRKVDWLAGCEIANKLYFWPCLLFSNKHEVRNKQGFSDINHLSSQNQKHSESHTQVQCYLQSKLLENNKEVTRSSTLNTETTSTGTVTTWRTDYYYLGLLTLLVIGLIKNGQGKSSTSLNKRNFVEFLNVLKNYDPILENLNVLQFWYKATECIHL
jgi:hypothetical protein